MPDSLYDTQDLEAERQLDTTEQKVELGIFLLLLLPSIIFSFFAIKRGSVSFVITAFATILRDVSLVGLLLFFLWKNSEPFRLLGWRVKNQWQEVIIGVLLFVAMYFGASLLEGVLMSAGFSSPSTPMPSLEATGGILQSLLGVILVGVVAISEETIFRGYLILRFKNVTSSTTWAVIWSTLIFAMGHGYEGTAGLITVGFMGLVFALVYLWRKSLVAPMVMHFLQDFIGIVVLPLLAGK